MIYDARRRQIIRKPHVFRYFYTFYIVHKIVKKEFEYFNVLFYFSTFVYRVAGAISLSGKYVLPVTHSYLKITKKISS